MDSVLAAKWFQLTYRVTIQPATIRQWARRRHITTYHDGGAKYDLGEIERHARKRGLIG